MKRWRDKTVCVFGIGAVLLTGCTLKGAFQLTNAKLLGGLSFDSSGLVNQTVVHLDRMKAVFDAILVVKASFENVGTVTADVLRELPKDCDVVFVVDNTGSMEWAIQKVQHSVVDAMREAPDRHYGVVTYRDIGASFAAASRMASMSARRACSSSLISAIPTEQRPFPSA